ncbi:MAG TPA: DMT family transporter [Dehalococcoidia bacterium]|nr:DMT family transporter [Dehalococcoidia bacterium]
MPSAARSRTEQFHPSDWGLFVSIAGIWGASFLLIAIGLDSFGPGLVTWLRVALGAGALALVPAARTRIESEDRPRLIALSVVWVAIPFSLFPLAEQHINSAVTGLLNGATPIFAGLAAAIFFARRPRGSQLHGIVIGFSGVALVSVGSSSVGGTAVVGVAMVLAATFCYGIALNMTSALQAKYGSVVVMARMLALATIWTAPYGIFDLFRSDFGAESAIAVAVLGIVGTGIAFAIMASLVGRVGPTRSSFITYLIPVVSLLLGVVFRDDSVTVLALVGIILVIGGALLASRPEA